MSLRRPTQTTASPLPDRNENRTEQTHLTTALMNVGDDASVDVEQMTRAQRAALPVSADVVHALAEQHGVCTRPLAMRRIDTVTGRIDIIPVPCGSTREDQCRPCADKARRLRMAQCRQGWHLEHEPVIDRATPSEDHQELMAARADLLAAYTECKTRGDELTCEQIADSMAELDKNFALLGSAAGSLPLIHHPSPSSVPPAAAKTPQTCPADQSRKER